MPSLPLPSSEAQAHSDQLRDLIHQDIVRQGGWIPFSRFMELALYAPGMGYYSAGARKFGAAGDFVTAPEISSLFGRTLARQLVEIMAQSTPHILELGAGSGKLAVDILSELEQLNSLPERYDILEVSTDLRERQQALLQARLPHLINRVHWLDMLPDSISGVLVANEVLDALPVHLVRWTDAYIVERGVANEGENFVWQERLPENSMLREIAQQIKVPDDTLSEVSLAARGLVSSLSERLNQGVLLFIDYGFGAREYYHPQRIQGTLMCHYRHHAHDDPFFLPGLQDITAHVDFTAVAEAAIDAGLHLYGYTTQAYFLINSGITGLLTETDSENVLDYFPLSAQLQKLTSPAEMGELFKVIALGKGVNTPLCGFVSGDKSRLL
ncbi:SAM-dependent methyltransferase, MidA family [Candidatus Nitrotoga sp. BS]|uniref:class I SAM-dependent methyltransferase n=1 Tax=Candidatus Nitrotoga sp. BS TaxID=2890408 RepID=UPI001EF34B2F|nr:class I SAM-dependent methyltransferase [Candidatus Nitrotoga sp. BS]CAH1213610.1 SAM-dependent methyltransferase, MidA family [Candidatus Nitrotoga sp. BS]